MPQSNWGYTPWTNCIYFLDIFTIRSQDVHGNINSIPQSSNTKPVLLRLCESSCFRGPVLDNISSKTPVAHEYEFQSAIESFSFSLKMDVF